MVEFKDLSNPLKAAVIISYVWGCTWGLMFAAGFVVGVLGLA